MGESVRDGGRLLLRVAAGVGGVRDEREGEGGGGGGGCRCEHGVGVGNSAGKRVRRGVVMMMMRWLQ